MVTRIAGRCKEWGERFLISLHLLLNNTRWKEIGPIVYCSGAVIWALLRSSVGRPLLTQCKVLILPWIHLILNMMQRIIGFVERAL